MTGEIGGGFVPVPKPEIISPVHSLRVFKGIVAACETAGQFPTPPADAEGGSQARFIGGEVVGAPSEFRGLVHLNLHSRYDRRQTKT
jgi:hypothetical protein